MEIFTPLKTYPIKGIIFDLDGTLLDTITDIANSANEVLAAQSYPIHSTDTYRELVGDGLSNLARKVLPPGVNGADEVTEFVRQYREAYQLRWNETTRLYPGVAELLTALQRRALPLAVLSNKRDDFTRLCVDTFFPNVTFAHVRGETAGIPLKPDPTSAISIAQALNANPSSLLFVGDSEIDIETALRAGMPSIAVSWGFRPIATLKDAGACVIISHPKELLSLLDGE